MKTKEAESPLIQINLGDRAQGSTRAILWIRSDIEIGHGAEVTCTVRPREHFRPERLAILAACAGAFDLVDLKVTLCSVFTVGWSGTNIPAVRYATAYELRPRPAADAWISGPHLAVMSDETRLGLSIDSPVCPGGHNVSITVQHLQDAPPTALEIILWGTVMRETDGYRTYLKEQQALEQAWRGRSAPPNAPNCETGKR
jgi:hypothetical protein